MREKIDYLNMLYEQGKLDATNLRTMCANNELTDTEIIDNEAMIPQWQADKDYTSYPTGTPVQYEGQIYGLFIPHNASHYPGTTPLTMRTLWSLKHTKNPLKAKPYIAPSGTSGLYMIDECCTDPNHEDPNLIWRSIVDNNAYAPSEYGANWELI